jgi:hypothetical protein
MLRYGLTVQTESSKTLPAFPPSPAGVARLKHLPTIEASIRYWEAVSERAWESGDDSLLETANGLKACYEEARAELAKEKNSEPRKPVRNPRKARPAG